MSKFTEELFFEGIISHTNSISSFPGEKLEKDEAEAILKDCADPEDEDGFFPYAREFFLFRRRFSLSGQSQK